MASTTSILEIVARYKDNASGGMAKTAQAAGQAEKALAAMTQRLQFQARSAELAAKSLATTQAAYDKNAAAIKRLDAELAKVVAAEGKESAAAKALTSDLEKLNATNERLSQSIGRKSLALDKSVASIAKTRDEAQKMGQALQKTADETSKSGSAFSGLATKLGALGASFLGLSVLAGKAVEGFALSATLDQNRRTLGTLLQDVERGNKVFADAIAFGQKYGYTQEQMGGSISAAAGILKNSNQTTEKTLEVMARLASLNPAEGIEGATVAIKELASGDIVSLAERFNIAKSEANAMKDAIAAGADPIVVLDAALSGMGVTTQVLSDRMEGSNGALLRAKLAAENTTLGMGKLLEALGATYLLEAFAAGLNTIADGLTYIAQNTAAFLGQAEAMSAVIADGTARMTARGASFAEYAAAMDATGQSSLKLTESQYALFGALTSSGMSAGDADAKVRGLAAGEAMLADALSFDAEATNLTSEARKQLIDQALTAASTSTALKDETYALIEGYSNETVSLEDLTTGLATLQVQTELHTAAVSEDAMMTQLQTDASLAATDATTALGQALYDKTTSELESAQAAIDHANFEQDLAFALDMSQGSAVNAAAASAWLAQTYGMEVGQVRTLIDATNKLNAARAGQMGVDLGRDIGASMPQIANSAPATIARAQATAAPAGRGGRSGGGGSSGGRSVGGGSSAKSPEVKAAEKTAKELQSVQDKIAKATETHQDKVAAAAQDHADKLAAIEADYHEKSLAATEAFNEDKFDSALSFEQGLIDLDEDLYQKAKTAGDQYWAESQAMAQAGHAAQAAEYLAAGQALADIEAQNAQEMRDARAAILAEEDEAERARLEQRLARLAETNAQEEQLARDKVEKVKNGGDELEQERDTAIAQENADYTAAQDSLKVAFDETMDDIKDSYSDMSDAARQTADAIIAAALAATAAVAAIPSAPAGGSEGGESAPPTEGRASGGNVIKGEPVWVGEDEPEIFVPGMSGTVLNRKQILAALARGDGQAMPAVTSPAMARVGGGQLTQNSSNTVTTNTVTNAPQYHFDMRGASGPIAAAESRFREIARQEFEKGSSRTGKKAVNNSRS